MSLRPTAGVIWKVLKVFIYSAGNGIVGWFLSSIVGMFLNIFMSIFESASAMVAVTFITRETRPRCEIIKGMFTVTGLASVNGPRELSVLVSIMFGSWVGSGVGVEADAIEGADLVSPPPSPPCAPLGPPEDDEAEVPPLPGTGVGVAVDVGDGLVEGEALAEGDGLVEGLGFDCGCCVGVGVGNGTVPPG